jgi:large subunit ribosomal protein L9
MQLILLERIENLGQMGDVVTVKPGFARNFLLPQKRALRATKENVEQFQAQRAQLETANLERRGEAEQVAERLNGQMAVVLRSAGESGQLYGSVNTRDIAAAASEAGFTIDRRQVIMQRPVKVLGLHPIRIRLHPEVDASLIINVARTAEEAEQQRVLGHAIVGEEAEAELDEAATDAAELFEEGAAALEALQKANETDETEANEDESEKTGEEEPEKSGEEN